MRLDLARSDKQKTYDRRSTDLPINAQVAVVTVDDPLEKGAKLTVLRSTRDDPLAGMHARGDIHDHELLAGRTWQRHYEHSQLGGARAIDPTKERVDGGRLPEVLGERQMKASDALAEADRELGAIDRGYVRDILGERLSLAQCAARHGLVGARGINYVGRRFRDALNTLAELWGFRTRRL